MSSTVVTLYIQDTEISLLVLRGRQISAWARLALEPELVNQGVVLDQAALSVQVEELFTRARVGVQKSIVGLSAIHTLYRLVSLPRLPENIMDDAVRNAARRILPISLDDVYLSYQVLPSSEEETKVFMAAIPRKIIDTVIPTLRNIGVDPYIMDLAPLALCRIPDESSAIIIDSRASYLSISVVVDSLPQIIRTQSMPTEAESPAAQMATITEELDRIIAFYNSEHLEKPLDSTIPIFVCGDPIQSLESWQSLGENIGSRVTTLSSSLKAPEGFAPDDYIVNIGLALRELAPGKGKAGLFPVNLNVVPGVYRPQRPRVHRIVVPVALALAVILIAVFALRLSNAIVRNNSLASQLATVESSISKQQLEPARLKEAIDNLATPIEPIQGKTDLLNTLFDDLESGRGQTDEDLVVITGLMQGVELHSIAHSGDSVALNGSAEDRGQIFGYARALRDSGRFSIVHISYIRQSLAEVEAMETELENVQLAMDAVMAEAEIDTVDSQDTWTNDLEGLPTSDGEAITIMVDDDDDPDTAKVEEEITLEDYLGTATTQYNYQWDEGGQGTQEEEDIITLDFAMTLRRR